MANERGGGGQLPGVMSGAASRLSAPAPRATGQPATSTHTPLDLGRRASVAPAPLGAATATSTHTPLQLGRRPAPATQRAPRPKVVVSMTTLPDRVARIAPTIKSITGQLPPPDEVRLYVGFDAPAVPGATVVRVKDKGPATKLSAIWDPAVPQDAIVVTADDDVEYQPGWLETLVAAAVATPEQAVGLSGWNVASMLSSAQDATYLWARGPADCDVIEGWAGAAYRKSFFPPDGPDAPPDEFKGVDDVWISGTLRARGVRRRLAGRPLSKSRDVTPGLHKQPGFLERNRAAARRYFAPQAPAPRLLVGQARVQDAAARPFNLPPAQAPARAPSAPPRDERRPKLTVCISALHERAAQLKQLLDAFRAQPRFGEVELLVALDDRRDPTGSKRNRLVAAAAGAYVVHFDDDDLPGRTYVPDILEAIDAHPGVDAILLRGTRTTPEGETVVFDYRVGGLEASVEDGVLWRSPGHLCPVRSEIAKAVRFPPETIGEDIRWVDLARARIKTSARAGAPGRVLYHYRFDPTKGTPR